LKNAIHRAYILATDEITADHLLSEGVGARAAAVRWAAVRSGQSIADAERAAHPRTLGAVRGDKKKAADVLGISLKTFTIA
jgi:DNA-binding NtrC family response regulator